MAIVVVVHGPLIFVVATFFSCHCGKETTYGGYCDGFEEGSCYYTDWKRDCCRFGYKKWSVRSHDSQMKVLFCITLSYLSLSRNCLNESEKAEVWKTLCKYEARIKSHIFRWMTETLRQMILLKYFLTLM